jgi:hypothetical protein
MSLYLDIKYVQLLASCLQRFKRKSDYVWSMRCPFCGDSQKKKTKARGYIYRRKSDLYFFCHNCNKSVTIGTFIKFLNAPLYEQYRLERYTSGEGGHKSHAVPEFKDIKPKKLAKIQLGLPNIEELLDSHVAKKYLIERQIPEKFLNLFYYCSDFKEWAIKITDGEFKEKYHSETSDPRIVIPFFDQKQNMVMLQGRSLLPSKLRYVTIKFDQEAPKVFGLERWDKRKPTLVVEGPFDSLFLPNCLAMAGSSVNVSCLFSNKKDVTYVFDNERRNKEIVSRMRHVINEGYNICIWPEINPNKDINDMILSGRTTDSIVSEIEDNTYNGLSAILNLESWKRC